MDRQRVFFSYATDDREKVAPYVDAFKSVGLDIWIDHECINYGESIVERISDAIQECRDAILFHSENYSKKPWTNREKQALIYAQMGSQDREVVVVRLDSSPIDPLLADRLWRHDNNPSGLANWFAHDVTLDNSPSCVESQERRKEIPKFVSTLDLASVERLASALGDALHDNVPHEFRVSLKGYGTVHIGLIHEASKNDMDELLHLLRLCDIAHTHVRVLKEQLVVDGLGVFKSAFEIHYAKRIGELDEVRQELREHLDNLILTARTTPSS